MSAQPPTLPGQESWPGQVPQSSGAAPIRRSLDLADPGRRLLGAIIDTLIASIPLILEIRSRIGPSDNVAATAAAFYLGVLVIWFVNDVILTAATGGSIGKLLLRMRVVRLEDWTPIGAGIAMRRWATRVVCNFIPFLGLVDALWIFTGTFRQTLHDKAAQTVVVRVPRGMRP